MEAYMNGYQFDALKFATEGLTAYGTTIRMNKANLPSFLFPVYQLTNEQLFTGGSNKVHSAFNVDGVLYSKFLMSRFINTIVNGYAVSWPGVDPQASINYDNAHKACNANGEGWHLASIPERAVINHLIYKSGFVPHGNTQYGKHHTYTYEVGEPTADEAIPDQDGKRRTTRTATGSGPSTWFHNGERTGIADWVGNVWKWFSGMRLVDGEIQIFPGNLAANQVAAGAESTYWKAITPEGNLVAPKTAGTLKITNALTIGTDRKEAGTPSKLFKNITAEAEVNIPEILKELGLFPVDGETKYEGNVYVNTDGERLPIGGAGFGSASHSGPSALDLLPLRSHVGTALGFLSALMEK